MLRVQLKVKDTEVATLRANEDQLHSTAEALKAQLGFREGQHQQLVENAQVMVQNAEQAVLSRVRPRTLNPHQAAG